MTAAVLTRLPLAAGSAVATAAGRAGLWALGHFARAPLASVAITAMVGFSALAGSNALYFQTARHPAPFFAPPINADGQPAPELSGQPGVRSRPLLIGPTGETTGGLAGDAPIGNADVAALQQKLLQLRLFEGEVDGYYGPMTATAIRAFELANGLKPLGAISPEIIDAIMRAPIADRVVMLMPRPAADSEPLITAAITPQPRPQALPALQPQSEAGTEDDLFLAAAEGAEQTLDAIVEAIGDVNAQRGASQPLTAVTAEIAPPADLVATPEATLAMLPADQPGLASLVLSTDVEIVAKVQRGLASLGFLHGAIDGVAGEATSKAIRNFEVYFRYQVTGRVTPDLVDLLISKGAVI